MLDEIDAAAVTGQTVVVSATVSVTRNVDTFSGDKLAKLVREAELAGQSVKVGAQLRTVWIDVARTVSVVSCSRPSEVRVMACPLDWLVGAAGEIEPSLELGPTDMLGCWLVVREIVVKFGKPETGAVRMLEF